MASTDKFTVKGEPLFQPTELDQVAGILGPPPDGRTRSIEDMDQAITDEVMDRRARGKY
jgi:hypothetical protein